MKKTFLTSGLFSLFTKRSSIKDRFTKYYHSNYWGGKESLSGRGSDSSQTETLLIELRKLFNDLSIKTVLDVPCGDFNWMKNLDFSHINYIGGDIVVDLINKNKTNFGENPNVHFQVIDITETDLPKVDLIICRDCLVHLSYKDIKKAISKIKQSNSGFLLATSFTERKKKLQHPNWRLASNLSSIKAL